MTTLQNTKTAGVRVESAPAGTKALLTCGIIAGPLFTAVVLVLFLTREGIDPKKHPLSMLSLSELGWMQITNFVVAGLLACAAAVGLRRALHPGRAGTWGPILFWVYGIGLIWGGVFVADPAFGYPIGTPDSAPEQLSWHGTLHGIAPAAAGVALIVACFVFARRFTADGKRGLAIYSIVTAVVYLILSVITFPLEDYRIMFLGGALIWIWSAVAVAQVRKSVV